MLKDFLDSDKINDYFSNNKYIHENLNIMDSEVYLVELVPHGYQVNDVHIIVLNTLLNYKFQDVSLQSIQNIVTWILEIMDYVENKDVKLDYNLFFIFDTDFDKVDTEGDENIYGFLYDKNLTIPAYYKLDNMNFDDKILTISIP